MKAPILNLSDVPLRPWGHGVDMPGAGTPPERYSAKLGAIGSSLGAKSLGYGLVVVPPGKSAWPPGPDGTPTLMRMIMRAGETLAYWQDEK